MYNLALVGCGRISRKHLSAISSLSSHIQISALCDINQDRLEEAVKFARGQGLDMSNISLYKDYGNLLASSQGVDLVVLLTPSGLHSSQAILAANSGYNVLTEKPLATRYTDGQAMIEAFDKNKRELFVVKQNRFNPSVQLLKKHIELGRFGRIASVVSNVFWTRPQSYYDADAWRGTWEFDGGALLNQASHYFDLLDWLIGPVKSVFAVTNTLERKIEVEDTASVLFNWRNGAIGSLNVTTLTYNCDLEGSITIIGTKGNAGISGKALNKINLWFFSDNHPDDSCIQSSSYETDNVYGPSHEAYYHSLIFALSNNQRFSCSGRDGFRSLELMCAAYRSEREQRPISLPLTY